MTNDLDQAWSLIQDRPLKIVFIAGPYFGDGRTATIDANINVAQSFAVALANAGIGFFCPHLHTRHFQLKANQGEEFYHRLDFQYLIRSNAVLFVPGWQSSAGSRREHKWAVWRKMPCFYPSSPQDITEIVDWFNGSATHSPLDLESAAEAARILLFEYSSLPNWTTNDEQVRRQLSQALRPQSELRRL